MAVPGNAQPGGAFDPYRDVVVKGQVVSSGPIPTGGIGYADGAGASVTQATNRTTNVTCNGLCGTITTSSASLAAEAAAAFIVSNNCVSVGDVVVVSQRSGAIGVMTDVVVVAVANGSFTLSVMNNNASGGTAETGAILINFAIIKGTTK
jgi:hypothetical protein